MNCCFCRRIASAVSGPCSSLTRRLQVFRVAKIPIHQYILHKYTEYRHRCEEMGDPGYNGDPGGVLGIGHIDIAVGLSQVAIVQQHPSPSSVSHLSPTGGPYGMPRGRESSGQFAPTLAGPPADTFSIDRYLLNSHDVSWIDCRCRYLTLVRSRSLIGTIAENAPLAAPPARESKHASPSRSRLPQSIPGQAQHGWESESPVATGPPSLSFGSFVIHGAGSPAHGRGAACPCQPCLRSRAAPVSFISATFAWSLMLGPLLLRGAGFSTAGAAVTLQEARSPVASSPSRRGPSPPFTSGPDAIDSPASPHDRPLMASIT